MFLPTKWPHRLLLLPKWKSDSGSGSGFSQFFDSRYGSGPEIKMQNPAGIDSGYPDPSPPLVRTNTLFSKRGSVPVAQDDWRPSILQLNTEEVNNTSVIEQLAYKNEAFIIILQEAHCTTADQLVIPNFSPGRLVLNRKHGFATFVHERFEWSLVDHTPE